MEHHFNPKAESFDSPKNKFLADFTCQEWRNNFLRMVFHQLKLRCSTVQMDSF